MPNIERVPIQYAESLQPLPEGWRVPSVGSIRNYRRSIRLGEVATHNSALHAVADEIPADAIQSGATREAVDTLRRTVDAELE